MPVISHLGQVCIPEETGVAHVWALGLPPTCILGPEKWLPFGLHWQVLSGLSMSSSLTMGNSISRTHR